MYIKQIIIQGFKSYKDQTVFEPFSPKHNVIVGRNGSGKSNFFAAIRFVLSDQYKQLGREDRQSLLHEGAGSAVMSAYVELIFDNSDERLPTNTPEVILRRTIGQKKDEYSLNRKNTTKQEVMSLLETAGFSTSNPYYIVPQGRVTAITNMKDHERLNMLKTVAGTEVYESRRAESRNIMSETEHKRSRIDDLLEHIRGRLSELEEEKEELRAFQERDRERRCLEYTVHHKDQESLEEALAKVNEATEGGVEQTDDNRDALIEGEKQLSVIDGQIRELQQQIRLLNEERTQYKEDRLESAKIKAQAESDVQSILDGQTALQQERAQRAGELKDIQSQIKKREAELTRMLPEYHSKRDEERRLKQQLEDTEASRQSLYAKQGRQTKFRSKKERDDWLRREIGDVNTTIAKRKAISLERTEDIAALYTQVQSLETEIAELRHRLENRGDEQQTISAEVQQAKEEKQRVEDQRKELVREHRNLDSVVRNAHQEYEKAETALGYTMDRNVHVGLQSLRRIVEQRNISGAYGVLGELIEYPSKYRTAIEVTAGMSLFDYIVDTEETALQLGEILKKDKLGRVTFLPLSKLRVRPVNIPNASDAVHLVTKIKYNPEHENAMQQVFGHTIVCPNLKVAEDYARSHHLTAITPDGDLAKKSGEITGGWHDESKSRLQAIGLFMTARDEYDRLNSRFHEVEDGIRTIDQKLTKASTTLQKAEQKRLQLEGGYGPIREDLRRREHDLNDRRDDLNMRKQQLDEVRSLERGFAAQLDGYQLELASDFKRALSNDEEHRLGLLNDQLPGLKTQHRSANEAFSDLEEQKNTLEITLRANLRPRLDQLLSEDAEADDIGNGKGGSTQLRERQADMNRADESLKRLDSKLVESERLLEATQEQFQQTEATRVNKRAEVDRLENAINNHQKIMEKNAQKKAALNSRLEVVKASINSLGILPDAAFTTQYRNMSAGTATSRLHKVKEALKKFGHVNKKAVEQFTQFERQRETLEARRKELDASDSSIRELIEVLDQRKDQDIERTFKQVSREFARIFERLVPAGKGRLIIQRRTDKQVNGGANDEDSQDEGHQRTGVENYTGVGISVSFNSKHDEQQRIQQLSGGQKSLCALALVFAIQASDPAPFYLFDEIDANLDAQYRTAVAELLRQSSQTGQFICTTFRPEMLMVAEKCYGVGFQNKASTINVVSREDALEFVEGQIGGS